jgi:hypothetical protein
MLAISKIQMLPKGKTKVLLKGKIQGFFLEDNIRHRCFLNVEPPSYSIEQIKMNRNIILDTGYSFVFY